MNSNKEAETLSIEDGFLLEGVNEGRGYLSLRSAGQFLLSLTDYGFDIYNHDVNEIDQLLAEDIKDARLFELFVLGPGRFVVAFANAASLQVLYYFQPKEGMFYTSFLLLALPISKRPLKIQWDRSGVLYILHEGADQIVRYRLEEPPRPEPKSPASPAEEAWSLEQHHAHKIQKETSLKLDEDHRRGCLTDFALLEQHGLVIALVSGRYATLIKLNSLNLKQCDLLKNESGSSVVSMKALSALGLSQIQANKEGSPTEVSSSHHELILFVTSSSRLLVHDLSDLLRGKNVSPIFTKELPVSEEALKKQKITIETDRKNSSLVFDFENDLLALSINKHFQAWTPEFQKTKNSVPFIVGEKRWKAPEDETIRQIKSIEHKASLKGDTDLLVFFESGQIVAFDFEQLVPLQNGSNESLSAFKASMMGGKQQLFGVKLGVLVKKIEKETSQSISLTQVERHWEGKEMMTEVFDLASIEQMHRNQEKPTYNPNAFVPNLTNYPDEPDMRNPKESKNNGEPVREKKKGNAREKELFEDSDDEGENGKTNKKISSGNASSGLKKKDDDIIKAIKEVEGHKTRAKTGTERARGGESKPQAIREELIRETILEELSGVKERVEKKLNEQLASASNKIDESLNRVHQNANMVIGEKLEKAIPEEFSKQFQQTVKPMFEKYISAFNEQAMSLFEKGEKQMREKVLFESQRAASIEAQVEEGLKSVMEVQKSFQEVINMNKLIVEKKDASERELRETLEGVNSRITEILLRQEQLILKASQSSSMSQGSGTFLAGSQRLQFPGTGVNLLGAGVPGFKS